MKDMKIAEAIVMNYMGNRTPMMDMKIAEAIVMYNMRTVGHYTLKYSGPQPPWWT
jgi:ribulose kinase